MRLNALLQNIKNLDQSIEVEYDLEKKNCKDIIGRAPDILLSNSKGAKVIFEYERTQKASDYLKEINKNYGVIRDGNNHYFVFICENRYIATAISKHIMLNHLKGKPKLFLVKPNKLVNFLHRVGSEGFSMFMTNDNLKYFSEHDDIIVDIEKILNEMNEFNIDPRIAYSGCQDSKSLTSIADVVAYDKRNNQYTIKCITKNKEESKKKGRVILCDQTTLLSEIADIASDKVNIPGYSVKSKKPRKNVMIYVYGDNDIREKVHRLAEKVNESSRIKRAFIASSDEVKSREFWLDLNTSI